MGEDSTWHAHDFVAVLFEVPRQDSLALQVPLCGRPIQILAAEFPCDGVSIEDDVRALKYTATS